MVMRQSKALGLRGNVHLLQFIPVPPHTIVPVRVKLFTCAMLSAIAPMREVRAHTCVVPLLLDAMLLALMPV